MDESGQKRSETARCSGAEWGMAKLEWQIHDVCRS